MIRILTDSASDILPAEAATLGVDVIPLNVTLEDGTVIRDGVDLTPSEYYEHMAGCKKLPTTSQPSPELFEKFYAEAAAAGDEVVGIFLSHELSGTYQCAKLAADLANVDNVVFVDSSNVCLGEALLVRLAVHLRDVGKSACPALTSPSSKRSKNWAASTPASPLWPVTPSAPARWHPSRPIWSIISAFPSRWCARSAASSAPTQAPVPLVWLSLTTGLSSTKKL